MSVSLNLAINPLSFGQLSLGILRVLYKRESDVLLNLISGQYDFSSEEPDEKFEAWLGVARGEFFKKHNRDNKIFKLWHLNGALESFSKDQVLLSFYELDEPTEAEINAVKNNHKVLFSNRETVDLFKKAGCNNVDYLPLAFDSTNFYQINKDYYDDDRIVFSVLGKFEKRKNHEKVIKAWVDKYGDNEKYALHCAIWNPFLSPEQNNAQVMSILEGKQRFNVSFTGFMQKNKQYNDFLNAAHINLAMSGGEGWGLPEFHSVALGKHAVVLDCSGYKGWTNEKNSVLVKPSNKKPTYDNQFFSKGQPFNQGNIYDFNEHAFLDACDEAIERVKANKVNEEGVKLKEDYTYKRMVDSILKHLS